MEAERRIAELESKLAAMTEALSARDARIVELERLLEGSRRSGKRRAIGPVLDQRSAEAPTTYQPTPD